AGCPVHDRRHGGKGGKLRRARVDGRRARVADRGRRGRGRMVVAATPRQAVSPRRLAPLLAGASVALTTLVAVPSSSAGTGSWATQTSGTTNALNGLRCASSTVCWAVGASGTIRATTNGGTSWSGQTSGSANSLSDVACPSTSSCWTVGATGTILTTANGGTLWSAQVSGVSNNLNDVACPDTTHCWAVGASGTIRVTTNGTTWSGQTSGTTNALNG